MRYVTIELETKDTIVTAKVGLFTAKALSEKEAIALLMEKLEEAGLLDASKRDS